MKCHHLQFQREDFFSFCPSFAMPDADQTLGHFENRILLSPSGSDSVLVSLRQNYTVLEAMMSLRSSSSGIHFSSLQRGPLKRPCSFLFLFYSALASIVCPPVYCHIGDGTKRGLQKSPARSFALSFPASSSNLVHRGHSARRGEEVRGAKLIRGCQRLERKERRGGSQKRLTPLSLSFLMPSFLPSLVASPPGKPKAREKETPNGNRRDLKPVFRKPASDYVGVRMGKT